MRPVTENLPQPLLTGQPRTVWFALRRTFEAALAGKWTMAKPNSILIKLVSTADTGFYYVTKKNPRNLTEKLEFRKYDPVVRKHVMFKEVKIK